MEQKQGQEDQYNEYQYNVYYDAIITQDYDLVRSLIQSNLEIEEGFMISLMLEDAKALKMFNPWSVHYGKAVAMVVQHDAISKMILLQDFYGTEFDMINMFMTAVEHGSIRIASYIVKLGVVGSNLLQNSLGSAARAGEGEMFAFLSHYSTPDDETFLFACMGGNRDIINVTMPAVPQSAYLNFGLKYVAKHGYTDLIDRFIHLGATDVNTALAYAAQAGQIESIRVLIAVGATNLNEGLLHAVRHNQYDAVRMLVGAGSTNLEEAMGEAYLSGYAEIYAVLHSILYPYLVISTDTIWKYPKPS